MEVLFEPGEKNPRDALRDNKPGRGFLDDVALPRMLYGPIMNSVVSYPRPRKTEDSQRPFDAILASTRERLEGEPPGFAPNRENSRARPRCSGVGHGRGKSPRVL